MVIGGGPAGMEAARVAALRGHDVTLYEKTSQLAGLLNTVIRVPGREEFSQITRFLSHQLLNLKVKIKYNTEVTPEAVVQQQPDAVVVATGARPYVEPVSGSGTIKIVSPSQVLNGEVNPGKKAVVYECTGEQEGPNTAEYLGEKGVQVELVTFQISLFAGLMAPAGMIASRYLLLWPRLRNLGVNLHTHTKIKEISGSNVTLADVWSAEECTLDNVDTIVMSTGYLPNNALYKALQGRVKELYTIGDCVTPRRALNAIHEAYLTAFYI